MQQPGAWTSAVALSAGILTRETDRPWELSWASGWRLAEDPRGDRPEAMSVPPKPLALGPRWEEEPRKHLGGRNECSG